MFTIVHSCLLTYVYPVYSILFMFTYVYHDLLKFTYVNSSNDIYAYPCFLVFIYVYTCFANLLVFTYVSNYYIGV